MTILLRLAHEKHPKDLSIIFIDDLPSAQVEARGMLVWFELTLCLSLEKIVFRIHSIIKTNVLNPRCLGGCFESPLHRVAKELHETKRNHQKGESCCNWKFDWLRHWPLCHERAGVGKSCIIFTSGTYQLFSSFGKRRILSWLRTFEDQDSWAFSKVHFYARQKCCHHLEICDLME